MQGAQAYRQLAAQLAWEGTFEQNRNQPAPFSSFGQQSVDLEYEAFALKTTLDDLQSKHYPGVGNDVQKLHHAIDNLERMAAVRHEEDKMMALTKTALLKAVQTAKNRQMPGFERLPLRDQMRSATYAKEDVVRQLAETLNLDAADVAQLVQNAPALTPRPPSRQRTPLRSPRSPRSPQTSVTDASPLSPVAEGAAGVDAVVSWHFQEQIQYRPEIACGNRSPGVGAPRPGCDRVPLLGRHSRIKLDVPCGDSPGSPDAVRRLTFENGCCNAESRTSWSATEEG